MSERNAAKYAANRARGIESAKRWAQANPEARKKIAGRHYAENRDAYKAKAAGWVSQNPERRREIARSWADRNPHKMLEQRHARRARKVAATPADFDDFDQFVIQEAAEACKRREAMHGEPFEIDHMIPLAKGGLHKFDNIQVIPARLNRSKGSRMIYTKPGEWLAHAIETRTN